MKLGVIYARAANGAIGKNGVLPWQLPQDLAHFKALTLGSTVIMGRKTWESLPPRFRPLPGRRNIVVTRNVSWAPPKDTECVGSLTEALARVVNDENVWVIGGADIFAQSLPLADVAEVTEIDREFDGDVFMPPLGTEWKEVKRERHHSPDGFDYSFVTYTKV
jgi:dihydrofolate reductase